MVYLLILVMIVVFTAVVMLVLFVKNILSSRTEGLIHPKVGSDEIDYVKETKIVYLFIVHTLLSRLLIKLS